jgi:hypothetical protein
MIKKKMILCVLLTMMFPFLAITSASAGVINLYDWAYYADGTTYENFLGDSMPTTGSLDSDGLGTLSWTTSTPGNHTFIAFFDHEIDEATNTFFNEYGAATGSPANGQSWEIDEPGYLFGDIYDNVLAGSLDNSNGVPITAPDDVSMALGWDFSLNPGFVATIQLLLSDKAPNSGFYLSQTDPDSSVTIYYSSSLNVAPVPIPGAVLLLGSGLLGLSAVGWGRRKKE